MNSKSNKIDKCKWWTQITCVIKVAICCFLPKSHTVRNIKCLRASDSIIFITKGWLWVEGIRKIKTVTNALLSLIVGKVMSIHL